MKIGLIIFLVISGIALHSEELFHRYPSNQIKNFTTSSDGSGCYR